MNFFFLNIILFQQLKINSKDVHIHYSLGKNEFPFQFDFKRNPLCQKRKRLVVAFAVS